MWYNHKIEEQGLTLIELERSKSSMNTSCSFRRAHYIRSSVRRNESFTLIELLVVLAIIGLLASIILVSFGPQRLKVKDAKRQADIRQIMDAMEMCFDDDGQYPLIAVDAEGKITNTSLSSSLKIHMSPISKDPAGGNYHGKANPGRQQYCIYAILETISPTTYFCASEKGVLSSLSLPSLGACCY